MNFDLSEDEELLKALAERFVADRYSLDRRRVALAQPQGFSLENWQLLGELGLLAKAFETANGGLAASQTDIATVFEALGRGLVVEPLIDSVLVAGKLFEAHAAPALKQAWMPDLISGQRRLALAHRELRARGNDAWVETRATSTADGWRLSGAKNMVLAGQGADAYIVTARVDDTVAGIKLFLVPANSAGLNCNVYRLIDGTTACEIVMQDMQLISDCQLTGGIADIEIAEARANIARCAEALGIMEMLFAATLDYLRTRKQFGTALGSFQILQHRMVAQYTVIEQARSLLYLAVMADMADRTGWLKSIAGARAFISTASVHLGHEMIQLHGGMGTTDELVIGHGHKRLVMLSRYPEDAAAALNRFAGAA